MDNTIKDQVKVLPPLVTVLMSVYNGEDFLAKAIESILGQTFKDFEFLIINDGSRDKSSEIAGKFAQADRRIRLIEQDNKGLVAALQLAALATAWTLHQCGHQLRQPRR